MLPRYASSSGAGLAGLGYEQVKACMPLECDMKSMGGRRVNIGRPRVSIVMPVYNVEAYLVAAIQSVLGQSFGNFELIVVDDGSTDASLQVARLTTAGDPRVRILSQGNLGLAAARNTGARAATGRYLYFFDSDDLLQREALEICMGHMERFDLDLIAFSGTAFSEAEVLASHFPGSQRPDILTPLSGQELLLRLALVDSYSSSVCLYLLSRSLWVEGRLQFDEGVLHEDEAFTLIAFSQARRSMALSVCLFHRRVRADSIMTSARSMRNVQGQVQAVVAIEAFSDSAGGLQPATRRLFRRRQRGMIRTAAHTAERVGGFTEYSALVRSRLGWKSLVVMDPLAVLYLGASGLYFPLRRVLRWLLRRNG